MKNLFIIMPAYNEEKKIEQVAKEWHEIVTTISNNSKLLIIDDGNKDSTYDKLCSLKLILPQLECITKTNTGHGATLAFGYEYALKNNADYIFQTDSDGQTLPSEFIKIWELRENYSVIIGNRKYRKDGFSRVLIASILKYVLLIIFGCFITDANTPFRLMNRSVLQKYFYKVPLNYNLFNIILTVFFIKGKEKVKFIPITFRARESSVNSINMITIIQIGFMALKDFININKDIKKWL